MSVTTAADERLNSAQEHIVEAMQDMSAVIIDECWGYDEYRDDYTRDLHAVFQSLIELKSKLHR